MALQTLPGWTLEVFGAISGPVGRPLGPKKRDDHKNTPRIKIPPLPSPHHIVDHFLLDVIKNTCFSVLYDAQGGVLYYEVLVQFPGSIRL